MNMKYKYDNLEKITTLAKRKQKIKQRDKYFIEKTLKSRK